MKTILIPTDFSEYADRAIRTGVQLAHLTGARVILVHNVHTLLNWNSLGSVEREKFRETWIRTQDAETRLDKLMRSTIFEDIDVLGFVTHGVFVDEVLTLAHNEQADIIVMGIHGNEKSERYFIGSNFQKVIRQFESPVLAVKAGYAKWNPITAVFAANLDEDLSEAFDGVRDALQALGVIVHLLYVNTPAKFKTTREIEEQMDAFIHENPNVDFIKSIYNHTDLDAGILEYTNRAKADLIVMPTHHRELAPDYLIGIAESVAYQAQVPVMSIHIPRGHAQFAHEAYKHEVYEQHSMSH